MAMLNNQMVYYIYDDLPIKTGEHWLDSITW